MKYNYYYLFVFYKMIENLLNIIRYFIVFFRKIFLKKVIRAKVLSPRRKEIYYYDDNMIGLPIDSDEEF